MKESSSVTCLTVGIWKMRRVRSENGWGGVFYAVRRKTKLIYC